METKKNKHLLRWIALALVVLLAAMPAMAGSGEEDDEPKQSILSVQPERGGIDIALKGGGQLASQSPEEITVPAEVKLTNYLVKNGETVAEGDPIAQVDRVSVMKAIASVQETLQYLSGQIADTRDDEAPTTVTAQAGGWVKYLYAREGDAVEDVMLEHGALAIMSLDDKMTITVECNTDLAIGDSVIVRLEGGQQEKGRVESNLEGKLTVVFPDNDYDSGLTAAVLLDGQELGSGEIQIHSPWKALATSGTVKKVQVKEGEKLPTGKTMVELEDTGHTAEYLTLLDQRQEYEEMIHDLFAMYETQELRAPCDGIVTGVDEDGAFLLSQTGDAEITPILLGSSGSYRFVLLGSGDTDPDTDLDPDPDTDPDPAPTYPQYQGYALQVVSVEGGTVMVLQGPTVDLTNPYDTTPVPLAGFGGEPLPCTEPSVLGQSPQMGDVFVIVTMIQSEGAQPATLYGTKASGTSMPGMGDLAGAMGGMMGGMMGGVGGMGGGTVATFEPYSLETITVASVTSQKEMTLEITIDEQDIAKVSPDMAATVTLDALKGESFPATVTSIGAEGVNSGGSSKFTVELTLEKSANMLPGMNASAVLPLSRTEGVLRLPAEALSQEGTKNIAYTGFDEKTETLINPVTVTTGVSDGQWVEILSGLSEGDTVWYGYYDTLPLSLTPDSGIKIR